MDEMTQTSFTFLLLVDVCSAKITNFYKSS